MIERGIPNNDYTIVPEARVYRGFTPDEWEGAYARNFAQFERHMGREFPSGISLDKIIENQLRRDTTGKVTVVDFGAGDGKFTEEFLTDPAVGKRTRGLLRGKSKNNTSLDFWNINDSPNPYEHLYERAILPNRDDPLEDQIRGRSVSYSVTSSQTMSDFFKAKDIIGVDVVVASNSVSYLSPPVFEQFSTDVIEALKPGGQFLAFGYGEIAGERYCIDNGYEATDDDVYFIVNEKEVLSSEVRNVGQSLHSDTTVGDDHIINYLINTFNSACATGAFLPEEIAKLKQGVQQGICVLGPRVMLTNFLGGAFAELEGVVRIHEERNKKRSIVNTLEEKYKDKITIESGRYAFRITDTRK